jgi:hypothetical protein
MCLQKESLLREQIPETMLSEHGFQVLQGLLTCNPEKRLTAAAALKLPWFDGVDAMELPIKKVEDGTDVAAAKEDEEAALKVPAPKSVGEIKDTSKMWALAGARKLSTLVGLSTSE